MLQIVDHLKESEKTLVRNLERVQAALRKGEKVRIYHMGRIHGRLANLPGVEYLPLIKGMKKLSVEMPPHMSAQDNALLSRLTRHQEYRMPYFGDPRGDIFIHWFYRERHEDKLSLCEIFHLNMLRYFNVMDRVETIHVRCAARVAETATMREAITILSSGKAKVDFKIVQQKASWEHDTIKECVEYAVGTGRFVYYTHFKGASRNWGDLSFGGRKNHCPYTSLDLAYWSYIMYRGLFNENAARHSVIGPIACDSVNKEYMTLDLSWGTRSRYQYIGSFQGFSGEALRNAFNRLHLENEETRDKYLWWGGRYAVEMFLALIFQENEVYSIAQKKGTCAAYLMYTQNFCPQYKREFQAIYTHPILIEEKHGVAICAVAKNEDPYIREWLEHYRRLGAAHFYIYDNNDDETTTIKDISAYPDVTVIPIRGRASLENIHWQVGAYADAYFKFGHAYNWMGFFDIDEFVEIDNNGQLEDFLDSPMFDGTSVVHLHWRYYGDGGHVHYSPEPLAIRFKEPADVNVCYADKAKPENRYVKSFVRTGFLDMNFPDPHSPRFYGAVCRVASGRFEYADSSTDTVDLAFARIRHYGTKTIEEYIKRRIFTQRATGLRQISPEERLDWFFRVNKITAEKLQVIRTLLPKIKYPRK